VDIRNHWKENWKWNFSLVDDSTIWQPGFDLPRQQWSLLNHFQTAQGHCGAYKKKWNHAATDLCLCGKKQMMSHIVNSCPLSKLNASLSQLICCLANHLWLVFHTQEEEEVIQVFVLAENLFLSFM